MKNRKIADLRSTSETLRLGDASLKLLILTVSIIFMVESLINF
ncbi:hypothetical protein [Polaribacter dokdonensis]|jgi:hypothetical protein|uniref:Uncharacterized protein n=1 Tax=Polaribacter dokdonensis DSW-5 TaxID=1300348 RepID=A0A0N0CG77_9FLAO|nr:hypothetical protein [Polaribacter dokdonensis]KOY52870.1 hypothetical protein I602_2430 [Polaribacter dokdonensis DSW-5]SEE53669.1 hypothetical protein SAMN05444353_2204 [Polaribacter dokdonensis DSW-5]